MSGNQQFTNFASALLAANLTNVGTSVQVASGLGALFPSLTGTQYFMATIEDSSGNIEIVKCTARSSDILTVVRGQEGTSARAFTANLARVEIRETSQTFGNFYQKDGDTLTGDMNGGDHNLTHIVLGANTKMVSGVEIAGTPIRGASGLTTNEFDVPSDGTRATLGGATIVCVGDAIQAFTIGQVIMWFGTLVSVPALWHACDGSTIINSVGASVTLPDLRDRFVVGAGSTYAVSSTGGAASVSSSTVAISGSTDGHALSLSEIPAHTHPVYYQSVTLSAGGSGTAYWPQNTSGNFDKTTGSAGTGAAHTHTFTSTGAHSHTVATLPPYYGLFFIMYVG